MYVLGCPKCGDKRPLTAWALEAVEIERRNPSKLDTAVACYRRGCRSRNAHLWDASKGSLTLPGERTPRTAVTYKTVAKRVTVRQVLNLLRGNAL